MGKSGRRLLRIRLLFICKENGENGKVSIFHHQRQANKNKSHTFHTVIMHQHEIQRKRMMKMTKYWIVGALAIHIMMI